MNSTHNELDYIQQLKYDLFYDEDIFDLTAIDYSSKDNSHSFVLYFYYHGMSFRLDYNTGLPFASLYINHMGDILITNTLNKQASLHDIKMQMDAMLQEYELYFSFNIDTSIIQYFFEAQLKNRRYTVYAEFDSMEETLQQIHLYLQEELDTNYLGVNQFLLKCIYDETHQSFIEKRRTNQAFSIKLFIQEKTIQFIFPIYKEEFQRRTKFLFVDSFTYQAI